MSLSRRIAFNTVTTWLSGVLSGLIALLLIPFLTWRLGLAGYGLTVIIGVLVSTSLMADLGLRGALSRQLASAFATRDNERVNALFSSAMCCFLSIAAVMMFLFYFAAPHIVALYMGISGDLATEHAPQVVMLLRYYAPLQVLLWFVSPAYSGVIEGNHRFDLSSLIHIVEMIARALFVMGLVGLTELGLVGWAIGMLASKSLSLGISIVLAHRIWPALSVRPRFVQRESMYQLASLGGLVFLYWNVFRLSVQTDPLVLGALLGTAYAGMYKPAVEAVWAIYPFVGGLTRQMVPLAASMDAQGHAARLPELYISSTRLTLLMAIPYLVTLGCFAEPFVQVWLVDAHRATAYAMMLCVVADLIFYAGVTHWQILLGMNRTRFIVFVEFSMALVNLAASTLLIYLFREWGWGDNAILGAPIPTIVCRCITWTILSVHTASVTGTPYSLLIRDGYAGPLLVLLILLAVALTVRLVVQPESLTALLACVLVPPLFWIPSCWFLGFRGDDRARLIRLARQVLGRNAVAGA
ncbi:MAG: oligosaccharide flippase family protein [Pirellulales bacterium]|nr:oligosaccharide flippase family protein [Pirellulales bacterium]